MRLNVLKRFGVSDAWLRDQCVNKKMKHREIAKKLGCSTSAVTLNCERLGIKRQFRADPSRIDLVGVVLGKLTVVKYRYTIKKDTFWLCKCECGSEPLIRGKHIKNNRIQSCGCNKRRKSPFRKGHQEIPRSYFRDIKSKAKIRGFAFEISVEYIWEKFIEQDRKCALSGEALMFPIVQSSNFRCLQTASIDRIDSLKGYVTGNVQWVHKHINYMKQDLHDDEFVSWCRKVADFSRNQKISP